MEKKLIVFISYAIKDSKIYNFEDIIQKLKSSTVIANVFCFKELKAGNIEDFMKQGIPKSDIVLMFFGPNSSESMKDGGQREEFEIARKHNKTIIPVFHKKDHVYNEIKWELGIHYDQTMLEEKNQEILDKVLANSELYLERIKRDKLWSELVTIYPKLEDGVVQSFDFENLSMLYKIIECIAKNTNKIEVIEEEDKAGSVNKHLRYDFQRGFGEIQNSKSDPIDRIRFPFLFFCYKTGDKSITFMFVLELRELKDRTFNQDKKDAAMKVLYNTSKYGGIQGGDFRNFIQKILPKREKEIAEIFPKAWVQNNIETIKVPISYRELFISIDNLISYYMLTYYDAMRNLYQDLINALQ